MPTSRGINGRHPDLANPPVYPVMLAGLMKMLPFHWPVETQKRLLDGGRTLFALPAGFFDRHLQPGRIAGGGGDDVLSRAKIV